MNKTCLLYTSRTRDALVADFPGLTRDRKYGRAEIEGREFICIDTGGIDGTEDGVETVSYTHLDVYKRQPLRIAMATA